MAAQVCRCPQAGFCYCQSVPHLQQRLHSQRAVETQALQARQGVQICRFPANGGAPERLHLCSGRSNMKGQCKCSFVLS